MPTPITQEAWIAAIASGIIPVIQGVDGACYDPLALKLDDGTINRYETLSEVLAARAKFYFEQGLVRHLVITTRQSMQPHDPEAIAFNSVWGWRSEPLASLNGERQTSPPREFTKLAIARAKAEVDRLHAETGRTTTLYERHLSANRVLYVRG